MDQVLVSGLVEACSKFSLVPWSERVTSSVDKGNVAPRLVVAVVTPVTLIVTVTLVRARGHTRKTVAVSR